MGDAPAADAGADANAEDNKNKLKKKKNEPEKKEKLVIHGRKDEDILGSAYVKKYRRDDPTDWSRYADNPRGMLNRRRLTREERRRQFTVQNVVGDPRETAPRNFDALFEESDNRLTKPKTVTEAFRLRVLRVCGGRWWDRMYLFNLGWVLVLLPAAMEDDFGLGCAAGPHHRRGEDGRRWHFTKPEETKTEYDYIASPGAGDPKECQVLWPPLLFMVACTVLCGNQISGAPRHEGPHTGTIPPIVGAVFLRFTSFSYLKSMRDERRYWSAFFVLCLKTLAQRPSVPKEFHEAGVKLFQSLKAGVKALVERMKNPPAKITPVEAPMDCEEAPAPGAAPTVVENEDPLLAAARQRKSVEDLEEEAVRRAEEMRASLESMEGEKVEWRCVACGRRNEAPLQVKYDERCDIIVHRIRRKAAGDDRIRATFRTERYRPTCTVCQTPIDYRIRPSNASSFHEPEGDALRAFTLLAAARAARDKEKEEARLLMLAKKKEDARKLAISQGRLAPAGSPANVLAKTNALATFSSSIASTDDETLDSMNATLNTDTERAALGSVLVEGKQSERSSTDERPGSAGTDDSDDAAAYVRRMMEAQEAVNRRLGPIKFICDKLRACWNGVVAAFSPQVKDVDGMLFNDWSFKKKVKKFKPVPDRRQLEEGERYGVGDEVESFEHMPTWYPATVIKYNSNGSYVIRFHNGEEADAVPKSKIRYRIQPPITGLQQIVSGSFLIFLVVEPAWLCLFASNPTINGDAWWEAAATVILLPLLLIALIWVVAILLQMLLLYLRDGREAGPCLIIKIAMFYLSAPLFLLIFCCVALNGPTAGTTGGAFLAALILSFVGFLVAVASVASTVKPMYAYLTMVGAAPLLLFLILISLWCAHDPRGRWVSFAGSQTDDDGPLGVLHGAREGNEESAPPVLLEGYLYVMFLPAFFTYRLCWWLFHNLPHLWDANFAPPEDWREEKRRKALRGQKRWKQSRLRSSLFGGLGGLAAGRSPSKDKSLRALAFEETKEAPPEAEAPPFPVEERPATAASAPSRPETPAVAEAADEADEGATVATADEEAPTGDASAAAAVADEEAPAADEEAPASDGFVAPDVEE